MNEVQKARILYDVRGAFSLNETEINSMISKIESDDISNNMQRFFDGYEIEDNFKYLVSGLEWVKLLNPLGQEQFPEKSKCDFQVPDYMLFYENCTEKLNPLVIEVKSVKGDKTTLNVKKSQYEISKKYCDILNIELLYAIYWDKYKMWSLNCINNFKEKSSEYKISLEEALKNDLSVIIGDYSIVVNKTIFRRSEFCKYKCVKYSSEHEKYGYCIKDEISIYKDEYYNMNAIESVIIDSFIDFVEYNKEIYEDKIVLYEKSEKSYVVKVSNLILRCIAKINLELDSEKSIYIRKFIVNLMQQMQLPISYAIPTETNKITDKLFEEAFEGSWVIDSYRASKINKNI